MELEMSASQIEAIESASTRTLVIAGPGSGKTETLVRRVLFRVRVCGVDPATIVIITFTNAAANVVRQRLFAHEIGGLEYIGTLHGYCLRLLQRFSGKRINVLSEEQADELLKSAAALLNYSGPFTRLETHRRDWFGDPLAISASNIESIVVSTYYRMMRQADSVDYRSILYQALRLINEKQSEIAIGDLYVEEFQDSAPVDLGIYQSLKPENWFIVGDSDQAIYTFRGSSVDGILQLANDNRVKVVTLEGNYRSIGVICAAAQKLIEHNTNRVEKRTVTARPTTDQIGGISLDLKFPTSNAEELQRIVEIRSAAMEHNLCWEEMAVLARNNDTVDRLITHASALGIPVQKRREMPADWKFATATVDMLVNPDNNLVFSFWLNEYGRQMGHPEAARREAIRQWNEKAACAGRPVSEVAQSDSSVWKDVSGWVDVRLRDKLEAFSISEESIELILGRATLLDDPSMAEIALAIRSAGDDDPKLTRGDGLTITTFHGSKGREWEYVFIVGATQDVIPGTRKTVDIEAERRLFYVAMTRARRNLFISCALSHPVPWPPYTIESEPSQFIAEATEAPRIIPVRRTLKNMRQH